jgi:glutathione synthase/RimK-type ligase-like ATP-grasp enzyme
VAVSAAYPDLREDWPLLQAALADAGLDATTAVWTDPDVVWSGFDLVLANGAWDNIHRPEEFLAWADAVAGQVPLVNSPTVLRWNLDKHYLAELASAGVATVPTEWLGPGWAEAAEWPDRPGETVIKPTVSGGGFETARYGPGEEDEARAHVARLLASGRTVMVQPYQAAVDAGGEIGLIFLGGQFSHAISKEALLRPGAGVRADLMEDLRIGATRPDVVQLATARDALAIAEKLLGPTTYARVDLVPLADGTPAVLELELLDPALFFETAPEAAARFAQVLDEARLR